jgi:hypothetical protein
MKPFSEGAAEEASDTGIQEIAQSVLIKEILIVIP